MRRLLCAILVLSVACVGLGSSASARPVAKRRPHATHHRRAKPRRKLKAKPRQAQLLHDPSWSEDSPLGTLGTDALWRLTEGSPSVVIAVVDTGVNATPDLAGALLPGYDVADGTTDVSDHVGHGTLVAEIAAGRGDNGVGGTGVCWHCSILPVKVAPDGSTSGATLGAGIRWAADHGANVINVSLVLNGPDASVADAVAYAESRGALVVAAAGNTSGTDATYPAAYPGVVGVVATGPDGQPYDWARRGPWAAVAAPGCIPAADGSGGLSDFCGSSAAAPVVSGLAGLAWSAGASSAAAAQTALESTADPLWGDALYGRVDAAKVAARLAQR